MNGDQIKVLRGLYVFNQTMTITGSGDSTTNTFKNITDADLLVFIPKITARTPTKTIVETDTARDLLTIEISEQNGNQYMNGPIDIFALNSIVQSERFGAFRVGAGLELKYSVAHTALSGGAVFTFPLVLNIAFIGKKVIG